MGRLIDEDALRWAIRNNAPKSVPLWIYQTIDNAPTAYDPDRVVEQLEEAKDIAHDDSVAETVSTRIWNKAIQTAIGVVKGGGVNGN